MVIQGDGRHAGAMLELVGGVTRISPGTGGKAGYLGPFAAQQVGVVVAAWGGLLRCQK